MNISVNHCIVQILTKSKSSSGLLEAFRLFDKEDCGYIMVRRHSTMTLYLLRKWNEINLFVEVEDFKIMMTQMGGETFSDDEFEKMVKTSNIQYSFKF